MRKRLPIVITVLLITGIFSGWYFFAKESRYFGTSPLKAVSVESPFFVRIRNLGEFTSKIQKSNSLQSLRNFYGIAELYRNLSFADSLIHRNKESEDFLRHKELIIVPVDSSSLYIVEIGSISEKNYFNSFIREYFQSKGFSSQTYDWKGAAIQLYSSIENGENKSLAITFFKGVLIIGKDVLHIKLAVDQMDKASLLEDADYMRVSKNATENVDLNVFINHKTFPPFLTHFCSDSVANEILKLNYAKWTEVDVVQKDNQQLINGFTIVDSTRSCYLDIFKHQKPLVDSLCQLMPSTTTFFASQHISEVRQYFSEFDKYLEKNYKSENYNNQVAELNQKLNFDFRQYIEENWTGEAAVIFNNFNLEEPIDNRFFLYKVKSQDNDALVEASKKWVIKNKSKQNDPTVADAEKSNIYRFPVHNFGNFFGEISFGSVQTNWISFGDGFVLMGATPGSLKRYLGSLKNRDLLPVSPSYLKSISGIARTSNFYLWCAPGLSLPFFESIIKPKAYQNLKRSISSLRKIENFSWQWGYENGMVYNSACLNINPDADQSQIPFWRYPLKVPIDSKPLFVSFYPKEQGRDLIFQDKENHMICLDKEGIERWKIKLDGPVIGDIKTLDFHKNGEFQLLFNTKSAIHLIDKQGNEMKNYPVRLKPGATNEISVFDYDGKKDYRLLVACNDHKIYNFDKYGKPISGWQTKVTKTVVELPVRYFRIGLKDYLVYLDRSAIYIVDRQGRDRVKLKEEFAHSQNNVFLADIKDPAPVIVTTDEHGKVKLIGFDGSVGKVNVGNFSSKHFFLLADSAVNSGVDFVFFDNQSLSMSNFYGKQIFSFPVKVQIDHCPTLVNFGGEELIELYSASENRTILVRKDGSIFDAFLPDGSTLLSVGSFDEKAGIANILALTSEGFLANFQRIVK